MILCKFFTLKRQKCIKRANFRLYNSIAEVLKEGVTGESRKIKGWIKSVREGKYMKFCTLMDGSPFHIQLILAQPDLKQVKIHAGVAIETTGKLTKSEGKGQIFDFYPETISIIGDVDNVPAAPFGTKFQREFKFARQFLHFRPRNEIFTSFLRLRSTAKEAVHDFFKEKQFIQIDTPILTTSDCEGSGESFYVTPSNKTIYNQNPKINDENEKGDQKFDKNDPENEENALKSAENGRKSEENCSKIDENEPKNEEFESEFFGRPVFLTVSSQLHLEACACALKRVYSFNPAFRAESSLTRQHIAEFYMVEAELAFVNDLETLMNIVEQLFIYCLEKLLEENRFDFYNCLKFYNKNHMKFVEKMLSVGQFPRLKYDEAVKIIQKCAEKENFSRILQLGDDFGKEHEKFLVKHFGNVPIFVTHYPASLKPFYMKQEESETLSNVALCFDLLAPEAGEICGGSLREGDFMALKRRLEHANLDKRLEWYADLRRVGFPQLGGFGLGFERYLQCLLGANNIKDCLPFPRWYKHCHL